MSKTQMLKGVLEGCVLQVISKHETYGYQLVQDLRTAGFNDVIGGTIYPILQKLEKKRLISGVMKPSPEGPSRKYFSVTSIGQEELTIFMRDWQEINESVKQIFK
ncbi:PadR family transcriptional regulator [Liquorilactobacillus mali]|uniref:PadR-like family regulator protein n=1 Tax=Liquorilactobacillus mali KCTC 3596 = DSM 20444 TaxID=1046596 RepID=J0L3G6_9LACO|nr:PadR family transcriptional regulator [Liquorilactobacillus mali]EJE97555.1 PadR family transcriptional regulator, regulatory protein [Liquorilactobacillus mali KCTC 3596 = DSM 20444]KRN08861.1 PadR-like family regulator protein [Liquorilactobacillus mali KCTC 3596 = DSM 20444]MDC7952978.1 PadR family transcriptional regulator [Liquorilactobacillus mali]MDV7758803.1 PadR family transcriptional regulator [Liquorilactobacillus mali]QFQ73982.1 PadR family transcriptional regulator [Liquorilact